MTKRTGGRSARRAMRAAPLPDDMRPIRAGMEGGLYKPLSDSEVAQIHESALEVLDTIGISQAIPSCIAACTSIGAEYRDGRLYFPRKLVEHTIATANRDFTLYGRNPKHHIHPQGAKVHYGTGGAAVHVVDVETGKYRESYLVDIYDAARIVEVQDNIHFFQRPMVARDMENDYDLDLNTLYACLSGTTKHVGVSFTTAENVKDGLELMYTVAGSEAEFRERPFVSGSVCFVVPPLRFAQDACDVMEALIKGGVPILLLSAGQAGATSPAAIAGSVVQAVAEVLAGLIYVNALAPGHPAIFGTWPFVSDLRTGAMSGGSAEQALLTAACGQIANHYGLVGGSPASMADSKMPDIQSGYEKGITTVTAGLAGTNLIYEAAGMHASLMGFCMEGLIIDNDILGQSLRCVRGIDVNVDTMSVQTMRDVCLGGPEHYLGHAQTLSLMQTEYFYPTIGDRLSAKEWEAEGRTIMIDRAIKEKDRILEEHFPDHISAELDAEIRRKFDIKLPRAKMRRH